MSKKHIGYSLIESRFASLCNLLGKKVAENYEDVGAWKLEYDGVFGGFSIVEIKDKYGTVSYPLTFKKFPDVYFLEMLLSIELAVEIFCRQKNEIKKRT